MYIYVAYLLPDTSLYHEVHIWGVRLLCLDPLQSLTKREGGREGGREEGRRVSEREREGGRNGGRKEGEREKERGRERGK